MPISENHLWGLKDLLINEKNNIPVLLQVAKSVTKNISSIEKPEEALLLITNHIDNIHKLLFKRHFTKDLLWRYLNTRKPNTTTDFSKSDLVIHVLQYWEQSSNKGIANLTTVNNISLITEEEYPIHLLARKFCEWFFDNFNKNSLSLADFWTDSFLRLNVVADDAVKECEYTSSSEVLGGLVNAKQQFGFHFNPNLTHGGVQGRINPHGLVMVLSCGTLHTAANIVVGVFECIFGLLRDPYADNNWKVKKIICLLRSEQSPSAHSLNMSQSLQDALALPATSESLD